MQVRTPQERDRDGWLRLRLELWPTDDPDSYRGEMRGMEARPDHWGVFVCVDDDERVVGFAEVSMRERLESIERERVGHLEGWYVDPRRRRQGIGRKLVDAVVAWVRQRGGDVLHSDAELDDLLSHRAHAALGFVETHREVLFKRSLK
jgi:aminoglycoside 6'-N-acetyltransferase I